MGLDLNQEAWLNFLRFDVLTRISLLGEEIKLRGTFVHNAANLIQQTEELVLCLEENPEAIVLLDTIFGNIHTLKGGSSFLQPKTLERFMHRFEDLINQLRSGERVISSQLITGMLKVLDKTKELVEDLNSEFHHLYSAQEIEDFFNWDQPKDKVEVSGDALEDEARVSIAEALAEIKDWDSLSGNIEANQGGQTAESNNSDLPIKNTVEVPPNQDSAVLASERTDGAAEKVVVSDGVNGANSAAVSEVEPIAMDSVEAKTDGNGKANSTIEVAGVAPLSQEMMTLDSPPVDREFAGLFQNRVELPAIEGEGKVAGGGGGHGGNQGNLPSRKKEEKSLKVPIPLLDTLMHISGELTVVRNMINKLDRNLKVRYTGDKDLERMSSLLEELHKLNGSIQTHILDLRKVPVKEIVAPLNRVVRDVSKQLGKVVSLKVQGAELRIDTALAEILNNTLIHLVRNSIDHGLETAEERTKKGKSSGGTLGIDAFQENDNVYIRIKDDGRGLQTERIRSRAIERGLVSEEQGKLMKETEIWPLILAPGFSTAEKVTDISGRGIGMSAVKEAVEAIGGEVLIQSEPDNGSIITLSMPLPKSVLITRCLFIMISGMQLGVPNESVYRIVHFDGENDTAKLTKVEDSYVLSLEEELIPVVQLDQLLGTAPIEIDESRVKTVAVLRTSKGAAMGIVVSDVLEFEDTVVKPFTDHLKAFDVFFGTTFLGDGSIGLIFNVDGLVESYKQKAFTRFSINVKTKDLIFQDAAS